MRRGRTGVPLRGGHHAARRARANAPMFKEYLRYIANRRCQQIGVNSFTPGRATRSPG